MLTAIPSSAAAAAPQGTIVVLGGGYDDPTLALLAGLPTQARFGRNFARHPHFA